MFPASYIKNINILLLSLIIYNYTIINVFIKVIITVGYFINFPMLFRSGLTLLANVGNIFKRTYGLNRYRINDLLLIKYKKLNINMRIKLLIISYLLWF